MISLKQKVEIFRHKAKYSLSEQFGKAQAIQELIESLGIYIPQDECNHINRHYNNDYNMCISCGYLTKKAAPFQKRLPPN